MRFLIGQPQPVGAILLEAGSIVDGEKDDTAPRGWRWHMAKAAMTVVNGEGTAPEKWGVHRITPISDSWLPPPGTKPLDDEARALMKAYGWQ